MKNILGVMKGVLKTIVETNQSIPNPKEVGFGVYHHHCRAQKDTLNYM